MGFHPHSADIDRPLALQPLIGHPGLCRRRPRQVPVAFSAECRQDRVAFARSQGQQVAYLGSCSAPPFPVAHANAAAQPRVEFWNRAVVVRDAKIAHPPAAVGSGGGSTAFAVDLSPTPVTRPGRIPDRSGRPGGCAPPPRHG